MWIPSMLSFRTEFPKWKKTSQVVETHNFSEIKQYLLLFLTYNISVNPGCYHFCRFLMVSVLSLFFICGKGGWDVYLSRTEKLTPPTELMLETPLLQENEGQNCFYHSICKDWRTCTLIPDPVKSYKRA